MPTDERKVKGGSFKTMQLMQPLFKALLKSGYTQPTPIQRKTIPLLLAGKDVVALARTGSGKTVSFLIPLIQKLKCHTRKVAIRGLILSPTRELTLQTHSVLKSLLKYTDLRCCTLIGGESLDQQRSALSENPDIVIATPGRLLHMVSEAGISLKSVEFLILDEADFLFNLGFSEQIDEIIAKLPESRQNALFSATMPKDVSDFAKLKLPDSTETVRLDVESRFSPDLRTVFLHLVSEFKEAALLHLLKKFYTNSDHEMSRSLALIFVSTKHHVEYLYELLALSGFKCVHIHGSMDQAARKIAMSKFKSKSHPILVTTDVAARGLDIPHLDLVFNYDFPATSELFLHRVGRVARAGKVGFAYSFLAADELPYFIDLQRFSASQLEFTIGKFPQHILDGEHENVVRLLNTNGSVVGSLKGVCENALKLYSRTRSKASPDAHKRAKDYKLGIHAFFADSKHHPEQATSETLLQSIKAYKPKSTVMHKMNTVPGRSKN